MSVRTTEEVKQFVVGCDQDLGGKSTVNFDLTLEGKGRFYGKLNNELREGRRKEGIIERGGYAGFRSKVGFRLRWDGRGLTVVR